MYGPGYRGYAEGGEKAEQMLRHQNPADRQADHDCAQQSIQHRLIDTPGGVPAFRKGPEPSAVQNMMCDEQCQHCYAGYLVEQFADQRIGHQQCQDQDHPCIHDVFPGFHATTSIQAPVMRIPQKTRKNQFK